MVERVSDTVPKTAGIAEWGLWLSLLFVLSPVLLDLVEHWISAPWSRYSISFIILLFLASRAEPADPPRPRAGLLLLAVALAGQIVALITWMVAFGRPFAAIAVLGMILLRGTTSLRAALLVLWVVPIPALAISALGGQVAVQYLYEAAAALLEPLGMAFEVGERAATSGANQLQLDPHQGGLLLATHMTGLAWYSAQRRELPRGATARFLAGYALLALPIQFAAIVTILLLLHGGSPGWMIDGVDTATWFLPCLVVIARAPRKRKPE